KRMSDLIAEISAASREQAQGVEEVNRAVTQMDQVTTQNASLVAEASSSTQALAGQARSLAELVAFFDLGAASSRRRAGTERPAAAPTAVIRAEAAAVSARRATPKPEVAAASARAAAPRVAAGGNDDEEWDSF
ncbi:MAG: methyl-accepting chemotaxis protein, partial [Gammaproteobacteria bacterium]|nr:methyl-accepting chemotaxis protein [Gammaproteobacteria bacterium]